MHFSFLFIINIILLVLKASVESTDGVCAAGETGNATASLQGSATGGVPPYKYPNGRFTFFYQFFMTKEDILGASLDLTLAVSLIFLLSLPTKKFTLILLHLSSKI